MFGEAADEGEVEAPVAAATAAPSAAEASLPLLSQIDIPEMSQRFPGFASLAASASATSASGGGLTPS